MQDSKSRIFFPVARMHSHTSPPRRHRTSSSWISGFAGTLNGIETARHIREKADIPVIFLTAYNDRYHLSEAAEVSPYGYLTKPFTAKDLVAAVEAALLRKRSPH